MERAYFKVKISPADRIDTTGELNATNENLNQAKENTKSNGTTI